MAAKTNSLETDWARAPPPSGPLWRRIGNALYNPEENSFLGRTPKRWGIVLVFYSVFYAVLALMFSACMGGLFLTLNYEKPTYTLEHSLIGNNPGVASRPQPQDGVVVRYNQTGYQYFVDQLNEFFGPYENSKLIKSEQCSSADNYGYPETPCFYIKLNKIIGWKPECYDDPNSLPAEMPEDLKEHIKSLEGAQLQQIWLSCWEEKSNDTKIEYPWGMGVSASHYPYTNSQGYISPVVAIRVTPPAEELVILRCRFWAKNIIYNKSLKDSSGYTRVQLSIGAGAEGTATVASD